MQGGGFGVFVSLPLLKPLSTPPPPPFFSLSLDLIFYRASLSLHFSLFFFFISSSLSPSLSPSLPHKRLTEEEKPQEKERPRPLLSS